MINDRDPRELEPKAQARIELALVITQDSSTDKYSNLSIDLPSSRFYWGDKMVERGAKKFDGRNTQGSMALAKLLMAHHLQLSGSIEYVRKILERLDEPKGSWNLRVFGGKDASGHPKILDIFNRDQPEIGINQNTLPSTNISFYVRVKNSEIKEADRYCQATSEFLKAIHDNIGYTPNWVLLPFEFDGPISEATTEGYSLTVHEDQDAPTPRSQGHLWEQAERQEATARPSMTYGPEVPKNVKKKAEALAGGEAKTVPLFWGATFIKTIRELGYANTTMAICELVDNSIEAGATEVRVYFSQEGIRGNYTIDCLVYDNGKGMTGDALRFAMSFGGSSIHENRKKIGRFGIGMKSSALSLGSAVTVLSWQNNAGFNRIKLDVDEIGGRVGNTSQVPDYNYVLELPDAIEKILTAPTDSFENRTKDGVRHEPIAVMDELYGQLGESGTIVHIPKCDRLSANKGSTLAKEAIEEMSRIYRQQISESGLRLYVNNILVSPFDPTYYYEPDYYSNELWLLKYDGAVIARSTLFSQAIEVEIPLKKDSKKKGLAVLWLYRLPIEEWAMIPRKARKDMRYDSDNIVSFVRNNREIAIGGFSAIKMKRQSSDSWIRLQIDFDGYLDEAFGISATKQGVRVKEYAADLIKVAIKDELSELRQSISRTLRSPDGSTATHAAERLATDSDLESPDAGIEYTQSELADQETALRSLAEEIRHGDEAISATLERLKASKYVIKHTHNKWEPFYSRTKICGKDVLTINTSHPFFDKVWKPIRDVGERPPVQDEQLDGLVKEEPSTNCQNDTFVALELTLLSLAKSLSLIGSEREEHEEILERLGMEWSNRLASMLRELDSAQ